MTENNSTESKGKLIGLAERITFAALPARADLSEWEWGHEGPPPALLDWLDKLVGDRLRVIFSAEGMWLDGYVYSDDCEGTVRLRLETNVSEDIGAEPFALAELDIGGLLLEGVEDEESRAAVVAALEKLTARVRLLAVDE